MAIFFRLGILERSLNEERKKERRQHRLNKFNAIEKWLNEVNSWKHRVANLVETRTKYFDSKAEITEEFEYIDKECRQLEMEGFIVLGKLANLDLNEEVNVNFAKILFHLMSAKEQLANDKIRLDPNSFNILIAEFQSKLDEAQHKEFELD